MSHDIPLKMTVGDVPVEWGRVRNQNVILGPSLNYMMVRYLDHSLRGLSRTERLLHLQEIDPRAARAYGYWLQRLSWTTIAAMLTCSESTARRVVAKSIHLVEESDGPLPDPRRLTTSERVDALMRVNPLAVEAWVYRGYRWPVERVARIIGRSTRTVVRLTREANEYIGPSTPSLERRTAERLGNVGTLAPDGV